MSSIWNGDVNSVVGPWTVYGRAEKRTLGFVMSFCRVIFAYSAKETIADNENKDDGGSSRNGYVCWPFSGSGEIV